MKIAPTPIRPDCCPGLFRHRHGSETDQHCTSLFAKEHDLKRFKAKPTGDGCHWAKAAFPISINKRTKPNYEEETTRHQRTT